MKTKEKILSGSLKIAPEVYARLSQYCLMKGLKINFFASEIIAEKMEKVENLNGKDKK